MFPNIARQIPAIILLLFPLFAFGEADKDHTTVLVKLRSRGEIQSEMAARLSPALIATLDSQGILKGVDDTGNYLLCVPNENLEKLPTTSAVASVDKNLPEHWNPVKRLKLSYRGDKPPVDEFKEAGLKVVDDYE